MDNDNYINKYYQNIDNRYRNFLSYCFDNINDIKNRTDFIDLKLDNWDNKLNVLFIEFEELPHCEYIIRNNIDKLKNKAKFTVVCSDKNYKMFKDWNLPVDIIIKNNITDLRKNINPSYDDYNILLSNPNFWKELSGEYILITTKKTLIFTSNIEDFYGYDYIGAPWLKPTKPNQLFQGNGKFSLRKKQTMLDISTKYNILDIPNYLKPKKNKICPEDIYFSQYLNKDKTFNFVSPDFDKCVLFSIETSDNKIKKHFGGNNFFSHKWEDFLINDITLTGDVIVHKIPSMKELIIIYNNKYIREYYFNSPIGKSYIKRFHKRKNNRNNIINCKNKKLLIYSKRYDHNWRHFLIETFFDLSYIYDDNNNFKKDIIVLICNKTPFLKEIFEILNFKNFIEIDNNTTITANDIILPTNYINSKRNILLNNIIQNSILKAKQNNIKTYNNLFLTRNNNNTNYRYVSNQDLLNNKLKELNYYFIEGGTIPLYQQIALIYSAKNIITQIGANCDNIIFSNTKNTFNIIYPYHCKKWAHVYKKNHKNCKLLYCGNISYPNTNNDKYNQNYDINFDILKLN